jgi:transcriptional regulator with XRE-family HTH domain
MSYGPSMRKGREYESRIGEYRILRGMTIKTLSEASGVSEGNIANLQNGMISPQYLVGKKAGKIKPWVKCVCNVLRVDATTLFPFYFCEVRNGNENGFTQEQMPGFVINEHADKTPGEYYEELSLQKAMSKVLASLPPRYEYVLRLRFFDNLTFKEAGVFLGVNSERIRQIEAKALRMLGHRTRARKIEEFWRVDLN